MIMLTHEVGRYSLTFGIDLGKGGRNVLQLWTSSCACARQLYSFGQWQVITNWVPTKGAVYIRR